MHLRKNKSHSCYKKDSAKHPCGFMNAKRSSLNFEDNLNIPSYITLELINKYLANECTKEEKEVIDHWYNSYDTNPERAPEADKNNKALRLKMFSNIKKRLGKNFHGNNTEYE